MKLSLNIPSCNPGTCQFDTDSCNPDPDLSYCNKQLGEPKAPLNVLQGEEKRCRKYHVRESISNRKYRGKHQQQRKASAPEQKAETDEPSAKGKNNSNSRTISKTNNSINNSKNNNSKNNNSIRRTTVKTAATA